MEKTTRYKILLVEDERMVREAISEIIDWNSLGYELVGEAGDGQEALEIMEGVEPDIILTDICMPFMNGLELANRAAQLYPTVRIVFVTGYDEFDYAQKAVKINACDYILKPVTARELTDTLRRIKEELDWDYTQKRDVERLREQYRESLDILRTSFYINLLMGNLDRNDIRSHMDKLKLSFPSEGSIVAVVRIENMDTMEESFGAENKPLIHFAILNVIQEILEKHRQHIVVNDRDGQYSLLYVDTDPTISDLKSHVIQVTNEVIFSLKKYMGMIVSAGIGDACDSLERVSYSYKDALTALEYSVLIGKGKTIVKSDVERKSSFVYQRTEELFSALTNSIKTGSWAEIEDRLDSIFTLIQEATPTLSVFKTILLDLAVTIMRVYSDTEVAQNDLSNQEFQEVYKVFTFQDLDEIHHYFKEFCRRLYDRLSMLRQDDWSSLAEKACIFIKENFHKKEMGVQMVCEYLHLSASYFSKIFKSSTNERFVDYLTGLRLEKARELLKNTNMKSYEIADAVGYDDPHYFSHIFKKKTGMTPKEFRGK